MNEAQRFAKAIDEQAEILKSLGDAPKGKAWVFDREGPALVDVRFESRDAFMNNCIPGRSWYVVHRRSGITFTTIGKQKLARAYVRALDRVDDWFARMKNGDVASLRAVQRLNRLYSKKNLRLR